MKCCLAAECRRASSSQPVQRREGRETISLFSWSTGSAMVDLLRLLTGEHIVRAGAHPRNSNKAHVRALEPHMLWIIPVPRQLADSCPSTSSGIPSTSRDEACAWAFRSCHIRPFLSSIRLAVHATHARRCGSCRSTPRSCVQYAIEKLPANPAGIILSGVEERVGEGAPKCDASLFELDTPVLGICYGMQL